jgi:hypothetical protein
LPPKNLKSKSFVRAGILAIGCLFFAIFIYTPPAYADAYPQINVSGYKEYSYNPAPNIDEDQNLFAAEALLGGYYTGGPWQEKLKLQIVGRLNERLSVSYDLEQMPDQPDKFDVKVDYDKTELTFGDFQASFSRNEFVSGSKYLNGVMITSKDNWYNVSLVPSAKEKSETQSLVTQKGSNTSTYNLGHGSIIEDSERIELNNVLLYRGKDYSMDYFGGKITFSRILTPDDQFTYSFEFTNLVDIFFPTVSKKDFVGLETSFTINPSLLGVPEIKAERSIREATDYFPTRIELAPAQTSNESQAAVNELESAGNYKLTNTPIVPYSEKLTLSGEQLKKTKDYTINYDDGTIILLCPCLPTASEPLIVEYEYVEVADATDSLPGSGKGPYTLSFNNVAVGSESVLVSSTPYVRDLDYKIDYQNGKIMFFSAIPSTANVVVKYKHLVITAPPPPPVPVTQKSLEIGISYLKESGQRGTEAPSTAVTNTFSGSNIMNTNEAVNGSTAYTSFRPLTSSGEVEVLKNNVPLVYGTDYLIPTYEASTKTFIPPTKRAYITDPADISDGLKTGTIYFFPGKIQSTDEVTVSYNYSQWSSNQFSGYGTSSTRTYYLGGVMNLVPGAEQVQIWRKSDPNPILQTLVRNSGIGVFDGNYSINYSDPPNITFNSDPMIVNGQTYYLNDINFTVIYRFVAQSSASDQPISHDVAGTDLSLKVGDGFNMALSVAKSTTDQVFTSSSTNETFHGDGSTKSFQLHSPALIIDGSEQVFMNGLKLNRDDQYSFLYNQPGTLTFFLLTPTSSDVISVDYNYQSASGTSTVNLKQGNAYKFDTDFKPFSNLEVAADYKKIDADFSPMGGVSLPLGSDYKHAYTRYTPLPSIFSSFWLSADQVETNSPISNSKDKFLHTVDKNFSTGLNPFGLAQISMNYRDYTTLDDLLPGSTVHNNDFSSQAYSLSVTPPQYRIGDFSLSNTNNTTKTISSTDTVDKLQPVDTVTEYYHTNNAFQLTSRAKWVLDYQVNLPSTISYESGSRTNGKTVARGEVDDLSSNFNLDMTFGGLKKLSAYLNQVGHNDHNLTLETVSSTVNETYHVDFVPIDQVVSSIDHNRQETPTVTTAFGNPKTEVSSANITVTPYSFANFGWSGSINDSLQENGVKTSGNANTYTISYTPISTPIYKLTTNYNLGTSISKAPQGTAEVSTDTRSFSQNYTLTVTPIPAWSITSGIGQQNYTNKNDAPNPITTEAQSQTVLVGTTYKPWNELSLSGNYSVQVTKTPDTSADKTNVDAHAIYSLFTYGTLNYDWSQEDNGGEVLGGIFTGQDYTKIIQNFSVNIVVPQNGQFILSSIVLRASYKWASFTDRNTPTNSFHANIISFDGTFNF